jgi:enoyl-CoA hydratase/carnithine racemase
VAIDTILVNRTDPGVVEVTLNRPDRRNALNDLMLGELQTTLDEIAQRRDDRVLVLGGAAGTFCSGLDLATYDPTTPAGDTLPLMRTVNHLVSSLHRFAKPTIAKMDGAAVGAGCNLALACDLVIATERARLSEIFVHRGLAIDGGGSWLLPRLVGLQKAKELVFLGEFVSGAEAARIGLVNRVVPEDALDSTVAEWARQIAASPATALALSKTLLNASFSVGLDQALDAEATSQALAFATEDFQEAFAAFQEKRTPRFLPGAAGRD